MYHVSSRIIISRYGSSLGYYQLGQGPGLVILHGSFESAHSHLELAQELADHFTVYLPDRRGRGLSDPYQPDYTVQSDTLDLASVLDCTDARFVFGVSTGGIIALEAGLVFPSVAKLAVYEPPFVEDHAVINTLIQRFDHQLGRGKISAALVTAMRGSRMGPAFLRALPRPLLEWLTGLMLKGEEKRATPGAVTLRMLAPTIHYDFELIAWTSDRLERFEGLKAKCLLMGGQHSPRYLRIALDRLQRCMAPAERHPVERIEFPGTGHGGSGNTNRGGKPQLVADALKRFFLDCQMNEP